MHITLSNIHNLLPMIEALEDDLDRNEAVTDFLTAFDSYFALIVMKRGCVLFAEDFGSKPDAGLLESLADRLQAELTEKDESEFTVSSGPIAYRAIGVRLRSGREPILIGAATERPSWPLADGRKQLVSTVCLLLMKTVLEGKSREENLRTRVEHLIAQHEMLKTSQSHAMESAIEEREKRLR